MPIPSTSQTTSIVYCITMYCIALHCLQLQDASSKCVGMVKELGAELVQNITTAVDNARSILTNLFESKQMEAVANGDYHV